MKLTLEALIRANQSLLRAANEELRHFMETGEAGEWSIEFHHSRSSTEVTAFIRNAKRRHKLSIPIDSPLTEQQ